MKTKILYFSQIFLIMFLLTGCGYNDVSKYYQSSLNKQKNLDNYYLELVLTNGSKTTPAKIYKSGNNIRIEKSFNSGRSYGFVVVSDGSLKTVFMTNANIGQRMKHTDDEFIQALSDMQKWGENKDLKKFVYKENIRTEQMNCTLFEFDDKENNAVEKICVNGGTGIANLYEKTRTEKRKNMPAKTFRKKIVIKNMKLRQKFEPLLFMPPKGLKIINLK